MSHYACKTGFNTMGAVVTYGRRWVRVRVGVRVRKRVRVGAGVRVRVRVRVQWAAATEWQ